MQTAVSTSAAEATHRIVETKAVVEAITTAAIQVTGIATSATMVHHPARDIHQEATVADGTISQTAVTVATVAAAGTRADRIHGAAAAEVTMEGTEAAATATVAAVVLQDHQDQDHPDAVATVHKVAGETTVDPRIN
jgi:hypothetical protein